MFARQILMKFHRKQSSVLRETSLVSSQFAGPAPRQPTWQADGKVRAWESQSAASQQPRCQVFQAPQLPLELGGEFLFHWAEDSDISLFFFALEQKKNSFDPMQSGINIWCPTWLKPLVSHSHSSFLIKYLAWGLWNEGHSSPLMAVTFGDRAFVQDRNMPYCIWQNGTLINS